MSRQFKTQAPKIVTLRNGDCEIVMREYIADIIAASTGANFNLTQFAINPGQASMFPWLSKIAQNFESYKFKKLKFCYETEAPSSLGGTLVMAVDYDASDVAPANKQQALAYRGSVRSAPWTPCCHTSVGEDLSKQKSYFVRPGSVPANSDIKLYDVGNLNVITQGISTNSATCGELYVEYAVKLMTPLYEVIPQSSTLMSTSGVSSMAAPLTGAVNLGQLISSFTSAGAINFSNLPIGSELLIAVASSSATTTLSLGTLVGLTSKQILDGTQSLWNSFTITASSASCTLTAGVANPSTLVLGASIVPTSSL